MIGIAIVVVVFVALAVGTVTALLWGILVKVFANRQTAKRVSIGIFVIFTSALSAWCVLSLTLIGPSEIGVVDVRYMPGWKRLPPGRFVAMHGEIGVQARLLEPGLHFEPALLTNVSIFDLVEIPQERIGIVETLDGKPLPPLHETSPHVWTDEGWYEPLRYLRGPNSYRGIQQPPLRPGQYRLHPFLFRVVLVDTTTRVLRFGVGEGEFRGEPGLGRFEEIQASAKGGISILAHARVHYRITPDSAYKMIARHGTTDHDDKILELVQSTTRWAIEAEIVKNDLAAIIDQRSDRESAILDRLRVVLKESGIVVDHFAFASIYPPKGDDGNAFRAFEENRAEMELAETEALRDEAKMHAVERLGQLTKAQSDVEREQIIDTANAEADAIQIRAKAEAEAYRLQATARGDEAELLAAALGSKEAAFVLAVRHSSEHGISLLPDIVLPGSGDELSAFILEHFRFGPQAQDHGVDQHDSNP